MPPKAISSLAGMLDSDDSDVDMIDARDENLGPATKTTKSAAARKPRKTKPASKRLSGGKRKRAPTTTKRLPLTDRSNDQQPADDTEEVDEFGEEQAVEAAEAEPEPEEGPPPKKRGRPPKKAAETKAAHIGEESGIGQASSKNPKNRPPGSKVTSAHSQKAASAGAKAKSKSVPQNAIETSFAQSQQGDSDNEEVDGSQEETVAQPNPKQADKAGPPSRQTKLVSRPGHRRAGSASDGERGGDPMLRRKLGDMAKKYETLQARYNRLQEVGIKDAEANFDRLKQQSQAQENAASELISSLKAELAAARKDAIQNTSLGSQITKAKELTKISDERLKASEAQLATVSEKLGVAQNENKTLQAKLVATRQQMHEPAGNARVPGSAVKGKNAVNDRAAAAREALAVLKEDLYGDLTGLIIRSVDRMEEADVFDCIQTGRNGTLHFRLSIDTADLNAAYEETEFQYTPRLDENRDRDLLEILPEYLTEEITFSRANAAKFYARICDTLTRRLE